MRLSHIVSAALILSNSGCGGGSDDSSQAGPLSAADRCAQLVSAALVDEKFRKPVVISSAALSSTMKYGFGGKVVDVPQYCNVQGTIHPAITFEVKLPVANWNERFVMTGNGGAGGFILEEFVEQPFRKGYAVALDDSGHTKTADPYKWMFDPTDPYAEQKIIDYGYRSNHETTLVSKALIKAFYQAPAKYSYFIGLSTGGRQSMMSAQLYPDDFDGWSSHVAVLSLTGTTMWLIWDQLLGNFGSGAITLAKANLVEAAEYGKCDGLDAVRDGIIEDPRKCNFDPAVDLPRCLNDVNGPACFTTAQIGAIQQLYVGPHTSSGTPLFFPLTKGSTQTGPDALYEEFLPITQATKSGWWTNVVVDDLSTAALQLGPSFYKWGVFRDVAWDFKTFNWDRDFYNSRRLYLASVLDANLNTNLLPVKNAGKKIIMGTGWDDAKITPLQHLDYYNRVQSTLGVNETQQFFKFYMIPGEGHQQGSGPGIEDRWFNGFLDPLVDWVERGKAPQALTYARPARPELGQQALTRIVCPYPQIAKYSGSGDTNSASNFACALPD